MLELPPKLRVGFRTYKILPLQEDATSRYGDDKALLGSHRWQGQIEVNPHYNPEEVVNSLLHEVLHAFVDVYNIDFNDDDTEERYVKMLSAPMTAFIRDNPEVIKWMLELCQMRDTDEKTSKVL